MAKVSELKFNLKDVDYKINVNCNSVGIFTVKLPFEVAEELKIHTKIEDTSLAGLNHKFKYAFDAYKNRQTVETLHILISFHAKGDYTYRKNGSVLFSQQNDRHTIKVSFSEIKNAVGLDFTVAIKQTIDGKEFWFKALLGKDFSHICKESNYPDLYHKRETISNGVLIRSKIIPFDQSALDTLLNAQEKFRQLSEVLYDFISQDEARILNQLNSQKLLNI